jgi:hypothetical protein
VITLTSAIAHDLSNVRNWSEFAAYLDGVRRHEGMSFTDLERSAKVRAKANSRVRELPTSTVSDALSGRRPIRKDLLESLLLALQVSAPGRAVIVETWQRLYVTRGLGPPNAGRVDEASPRELGVHAAIATDDASAGLPGYVARDFDDRLRDVITRGVDSGCFVLLIGGSSCGKTRSLYEAVRDVVPDWWLVAPARTQEIRDLVVTPTERTVLWLDDLHRYFGADPPLRKSDISQLVRNQKTIVVGTVWPSYYFSRKRLRPANGSDVYVHDRELLDFAATITVPEELSSQERQWASEVATTDSRIQAALAVRDAGLTQVLAAGPDLVTAWEQAPDPYARAIITVAADARRLGVQSPLPASLLTGAMAGYLSAAHRVTPPASWLDQGLQHATTQLHGAVSALTPVAGAQDGGVAGYLLADYLTQHIGRVRRVVCPPESLWAALVTHLQDPDDLRRSANTALARLRYQDAEPALRRLHLAGDPAASMELLALLRREDRLGEAISLVDSWVGADPADARRRRIRTQLIALHARAEQLRSQAGDDPDAGARLAELLADGGRADELRTAAVAGNAVAAEDLVDLLADRGFLDELRTLADGGHQYAAERFAELLAALGRADELRHRADAGDRSAVVHIERLGKRNDTAQEANDLARLRLSADTGDERAASELTAMLFDAGDHAALLAEVNAGTFLAAERYLALLTADAGANHGRVSQIRAFGLRADGQPAGPGAPA